MRNTHGYIPKNMGGGTIWDGRLKIRNTVEAVTLGFVIYMLTVPFINILPNVVIVSIRLVFGVIFCGLALRGIGGEPLSIWFLNVLNYSSTRTYVTLQPPQRELEQQPGRRERRRAEKAAAKEGKQKKTKAEKKIAKIEKKEAKRKQKEELRAEKAAAKAEKKSGRKKRKEASLEEE